MGLGVDLFVACRARCSTELAGDLFGLLDFPGSPVQ